MKLCRHLHIHAAVDDADRQLMVTTLIFSLPPLNLPHLSNPAAYYNTMFKYQSIPPNQALSSKTGFLIFSMCLYFALFSILYTSDNYHQAVTHWPLSPQTLEGQANTIREELGSNSYRMLLPHYFERYSRTRKEGSLWHTCWLTGLKVRNRILKVGSFFFEILI